MHWRRFFRRTKQDREQLAELDSYLQIATDENVARGMPLAEAREAARKKLGNSTLIREEVYRMNTIGVLDALGRHLRYALRGMRHNPTFAIVAILTLALGIGANTAIFSVVNGVLIRPLSFPQPDRLVGVWHVAPGLGNTGDVNCSPTMYFTYREQSRVFQDIGLWTSGGTTVTGIGDPEQVRTLAVTHGVLQALGVLPLLGRWFSEADDSPSGTDPAPVILTYGYWQRRFGGDKSILGRTMTIDSQLSQIAGVMPANFRFYGFDAELIQTLRFDRNRVFLGNFSFQGLARLKPDVSLAQANADVERMLAIWINAWPPAPGATRAAFESFGTRPALRPLQQDVVGNTARMLWVLMGTIGIVLLIACANVANLLLVRAESRQQELAVRSALGAGRGQIARELLIESVLLACLGGAVGLALAYGGLRLLVAIGPANLPRLAEIAIDTRVLLFTLAASLGSGVLFGLAPVLKFAGSRAGALRSAGRTASHSRERHRTRNVLVVTQVALASMLLIGSVLMIRTFQALRRVEPGFARPGELQTLRINIPPTQLQSPERVFRMQNAILEKIAAVPGITNAAFSSSVPLDGRSNMDPIWAEDKTYNAGQTLSTRSFRYVSPGFFQTEGTPLIAGRDLTWIDIYDRRPVALVSETVARELWADPTAALGKRIRGPGPPGAPWREIVGVVGDVRNNGVQQKAPPMVYWPSMMANFYGNQQFVIRAIVFSVRSSRAGNENFLKDVRQAIWSVNANLPVFLVRTQQQLYDGSLASTSFTLVMLAIAGAMALLLGIVGIYGVLSYVVSQRTREIGIRVALGAQQGELKGMFVRYGLSLAGAGIACGLCAAAGLTRLMESLLFGTSPLDPITYASVPLVLAVASAAASYIPARRAAAVDPVEALRAE